MYSNTHYSNTGFCLGQKVEFVDSKACIEKPYSPKSFKGADADIFAILSQYDYILPDTNELMYPWFESFLKLNAESFRLCNLKLSLAASVMMELIGLRNNEDEKRRSEAMRGGSIIFSNAYYSLFNTYPPSGNITHADSNLLDAARKIKFIQEKNVLIITHDKELTCSIYNACNTQSVVDIGGKVTVLYIDEETTELTHYHSSRLNKLAKDVVLPEWHRIGAARKHVQYFISTFKYYTPIMHSSAIREAFINSKNLQFAENLKSFKALQDGKKIAVMSTAMNDVEIRKIVEENKQIFTIVRACHPSMSEEDAIYHAIIDGTRKSNRRILLISNFEVVYENISQKLPTCYKTNPIWGCFITKDGFLRKITVNASTVSEYAA